MIFLSVVTINKNNAAGLCDTIESVLTQTGLAPNEMEYIIIDGASDDESVNNIKKYAARNDLPHKITYWVSEKDTGIYNAMNKGIRAAHGEYVAILNSGDSYVHGALDGLKEIAQEHRGAILYGAIDYMKDGKFVTATGTSADALPEEMIAHPASFVPLALYNTIGLYDESFKIVADYDLFCTFKERGVPFFYMSKIITAFDSSGISSTNGELLAAEKARSLLKHGIVRKQKTNSTVTNPTVTNKRNIKSVLKLFVPYGAVLAWQKAKKAHKKK